MQRSITYEVITATAVAPDMAKVEPMADFMRGRAAFVELRIK
jgi:hypothetical protein